MGAIAGIAMSLLGGVAKNKVGKALVGEVVDTATGKKFARKGLLTSKTNWGGLGVLWGGMDALVTAWPSTDFSDYRMAFLGIVGGAVILCGRYGADKPLVGGKAPRQMVPRQVVEELGLGQQ